MPKLALFLLLTLPCAATITRTQLKSNGSCAGSPCSVTVTATGSGNLLVAFANFSNTTDTISSVSGAGTWTCGAFAHSTDSSDGAGVDICYNLNSTSGVTTITLTATAAMTQAVVGEWHKVSATWSLDKSGVLNNQGTTTSPKSALLASATTGSEDVVVTEVVSSGNIGAGSSVTGSGWTTPLVDNTNGGATDDALSVSAGFNTQATFVDGVSNPYCSSTAAFTSGAAGATPKCGLIGGSGMLC